MIKVYATVEVKNNLITTIPFKGVKVRVEFTGGNSMKNIPAKLYTNDPFTQKALDSSDQLGRLFYLHQVIKEAGDDTAKPAGKPAVSARGTTVESATEAVATVNKDSVETPENQDAGVGAEDAGAVETPENQDAGGVDGSAVGEKLEFENLAEAVNYIATKYGEQVESESQVRKFIEEKEGKKCLIHKG